MKERIRRSRGVSKLFWCFLIASLWNDCIHRWHVHQFHPILFVLASETESGQSDTIVEAKPGLRRNTARAPSTFKPKKASLNDILIKAGKKGLGGGIPGALAGVVQVMTLMWLRTIINYQSRYGTTFFQALRTLLNEGGVGRLYQGVTFALIQAPLARFVSTAANDGVESLLANLAWTQEWGPGRTTVVASLVVGLWRMLLMRKYMNLLL